MDLQQTLKFGLLTRCITRSGYPMAWRYYQASLLSSSRKSVAQSWVSVAMFKTLRTRRCWRWSLPVISGRKKSGFGLGRQDETMPNQRDGCDSHPPSQLLMFIVQLRSTFGFNPTSIIYTYNPVTPMQESMQWEINGGRRYMFICTDAT